MYGFFCEADEFDSQFVIGRFCDTGVSQDDLIFLFKKKKKYFKNFLYIITSFYSGSATTDRYSNYRDYRTTSIPHVVSLTIKKHLPSQDLAQEMSIYCKTLVFYDQR